ncbi:hypothetical protein QQZ08_010269, partial [Neonectria magnoliae]
MASAANDAPTSSRSTGSNAGPIRALPVDTAAASDTANAAAAAAAAAPSPAPPPAPAPALGIGTGTGTKTETETEKQREAQLAASIQQQWDDERDQQQGGGGGGLFHHYSFESCTGFQRQIRYPASSHTGRGKGSQLLSCFFCHLSQALCPAGYRSQGNSCKYKHIALPLALAAFTQPELRGRIEKE